jgi:hypothetical protein
MEQSEILNAYVDGAVLLEAETGLDAAMRLASSPT